MWDVSQTFINLLASEDHYFEYSVAFGNATADEGFREGDVTSVNAEYMSFPDDPSVGGCFSAELSLTMFKPNMQIPRMAKIRPYVRATNGTVFSEWIPQGVFWIDTREETSNNDGRDMLNIHAYDSMMKTEASYPNTSHDWPYTDIDVVEEIATTLGVDVDSRTYDVMTHGYEISLPAGYSMREVLSNIAAMYGGNWVMNYGGDLLLIAVNSIPPETNYLIDNVGNAITFGGDRILV